MNKSVIITMAFALQCAAFGLYPAEASASAGLPNQSVNQTQKITGSVTDENGEPMIGVTVKVKGTNIATVTDFDGRFTLNSAGGGKQLVHRMLAILTLPCRWARVVTCKSRCSLTSR